MVAGRHLAYLHYRHLRQYSSYLHCKFVRRVRSQHLVSAGIRAWEAFSFKPGNISTAVQVFRGVASLPSLLKNGSYIAQTILTDAIMVCAACQTRILMSNTDDHHRSIVHTLCGDLAGS